MKKQLKLSPYNPTQKLRLIIDGAWSAGTGFLLIQYVNDKDKSKGVKIIHSSSHLLALDRDFSSMEAEAIALHRVITACHHWLFYCTEIKLSSDCQGQLDLLNKHLADVDNRSIQKILIRAGNYNWRTKHIKGEHNKVADALSRL